MQCAVPSSHVIILWLPVLIDVLSVQIALEKFSEATVGYRQNKEAAETWVQLFNTPYFNVKAVRAS